MAKKQKHPEHENLERWLVSYADFITLLFATFVVLYALSQVDIKGFKSLEDSIQKAFSSPSIMQGSQGLMQDTSNSIMDNSAQADSVITPLMMEYVSQKYEDQSMKDIEKTIDEKVNSGDLDGIEAIETDRGLLIRFKDDLLFKPGSAALAPKAKIKLDKVGAIIAKKFVLHNMRVEGHTDNQAIKSTLYPSNWELSSARSSAIIRYLIARLNFMPSLFTAIGFADTRPVANNATVAGRAKNRRVELLILKNKFNSQENPQNDIMKMSKQDQEKMQAIRLKNISQIENIDESIKVKMRNNPTQQNAAILNQVYQKEIKKLSIETNALEKPTREKITGQGSWLKPPAASGIHVFNNK